MSKRQDSSLQWLAKALIPHLIVGSFATVAIAAVLARYGDSGSVRAYFTAAGRSNDWVVMRSQGFGTVGFSTTAMPQSNWSARHLLGPPDTFLMGDLGTAWASATPDGQKEWIECGYDPAVIASRVLVYETYNPGALTAVTTIDGDGGELPLWFGKDPAAANSSRIFVATISLPETKVISHIKLYIDSPAVPGWNEIDAVGVQDAQGRVSWAKSARASSSYGANTESSGDGFPYWCRHAMFVSIEADAPLSVRAFGFPMMALWGYRAGKASEGVPFRYRPIPLGLFVDVLIYSGSSFLVVGGMRLVKRTASEFHRLRRGRCVQCGYDLRFDFAPGCPECGWRRAIMQEPKLSFDRSHENTNC